MVNLNNTHGLFCEFLYYILKEILQTSLEDNFIHSSQNYSEREFVRNSNYNLSYFRSQKIKRIFWNTKNQENLKLGQKKVYRGIEESYLPWFELDEFHKYLEAKYYVWPKYITSQLKQMSSHYVEIFYPLWNKCSKL